MVKRSMGSPCTQIQKNKTKNERIREFSSLPKPAPQEQDERNLYRSNQIIAHIPRFIIYGSFLFCGFWSCRDMISQSHSCSLAHSVAWCRRTRTLCGAVVML